MMPAGFLPRVIGVLVPLSFHRRRITQAAEVILSNVDLYASVTTRVVGTRLLMELRSPMVVPPQVLEGLRLYLARKLQAVLGLKLAPTQIYLVSLPPADDPNRSAPTTRALKRVVQFLPQWSASEMPRGAVSEPSQPSTFADLRNSVPPPQRFELRFDAGDAQDPGRVDGLTGTGVDTDDLASSRRDLRNVPCLTEPSSSSTQLQ